MPWSLDPQSAWTSLKKTVGLDHGMVGVFDIEQPRPDEVLSSVGMPSGDLSSFLHHLQQQAWLQTARSQGVLAIAPPLNSRPNDFSSMGHMVVVMVPALAMLHRWWMLLVGRNQSPFTHDEQARLELKLQEWQSSFASPPEPGMGRMILGNDNRLIHADPITRSMLLQNHQPPTQVPHLAQQILQIDAQRYDTPSPQMRDLVLNCCGKHFWINYRRLDHQHPASPRLYLEIRPCLDQELPAVGLVEDPRVAHALAYLHDQYMHTPSLTKIADTVHVSPFHFHRLFSRQVGISPKQYLQQRQFQIARWLLRSSRLAIGDIAQKAGFASHGHFTSTFHRVVGLSPSEYRDQLA